MTTIDHFQLTYDVTGTYISRLDCAESIRIHERAVRGSTPEDSCAVLRLIHRELRFEEPYAKSHAPALYRLARQDPRKSNYQLNLSLLKG